MDERLGFVAADYLCLDEGSLGILVKGEEGVVRFIHALSGHMQVGRIQDGHGEGSYSCDPRGKWAFSFR